MKRRVVITGIGMVTPLGLSTRENWDAALKGVSGIGPITRFDTTGFDAKIAGEVKNFEPTQYIEKKELKKMDRFIQYAIAAATEALADSGLSITAANAERVGVVVGSGMGGLDTITHYDRVLQTQGPDRVSPFFVPACALNLAPGQISIRTGAKGPNYATVSACATGTHCLGDAFHIIQRGDADAIIAGGTEATVNPVAIAGFANMKALSTRNDPAAKACRPFDADRDGFIMGEGSGILILEELESARQRGARIYAEVIGFGMNSDAYHITSPAPDGSGAAHCLKLTLASAGIHAEDVDYINAHGTSTPVNDAMETNAVKLAFGEHAHRLLISSTKSMTGHLLGAAGGVEAAFTALTLFHQMAPPTINLENPDPQCDLDYVANQARPAELEIGISNSFGFGSTNACLALKRYQA